MTPIFVYGTLKRGLCNHRYLAGQRFLGAAVTEPHYRMYDLGGYPGMIETARDQGVAVVGEVWEVDEAALKKLDWLEDVDGGEYTRVPIALEAPMDLLGPVQGYLYLRSVGGLPEVGTTWTERPDGEGDADPSGPG